MQDLSLSAPAGDLPAISDSGFTLSAGHGTRTLRHTWLDTFDWRLYRAGLSLERVTSRSGTELVLAGRDGEVLAAETSPPAAVSGDGKAGGRWPQGPVLAAGLPDGPLRELVAPVLSVRALLPVARAVSVVSRRHALNADGKTVAIVTADQITVRWPRQAAAPTRLRVSALRGYEQQAARIAGLLAAAPGVNGSPGPAIDAVFAAAGQHAASYSPRLTVSLTSDMPARAAIAAVLTALLDAIEANAPGVVRDLDSEFLHDLRVGVRRTRSVLKLARAALPAGLVAGYAPEFRWLGALTTPTRDLDVFLLGYPAMSAALTAFSGPDLMPFRDYLAHSRVRAHRELARGLRSVRFSRLAAQWRDALGDTAAGGGRRPAAGTLAARQIAAAHRRVLARGLRITPASEPWQLHDLRKRCKELRYLVEIYGSLHEPAAHWRAVRELKSLQDCLGEFQDSEVQQLAIRAFAGQMISRPQAPASTVLAMGEVAAGLAARQRLARDQFAQRFSAFASPRATARFDALTVAGR